MKKLTYFLFATMATLTMSSCGESINEPTPSKEPTPSPEMPALNERQPITLSASQEKILNEGNEFAFKFFTAASKNENDNVLYSPLSCSQLLALSANGADKAAKEEVLIALMPSVKPLEDEDALTENQIASYLKDLNIFNNYLGTSLKNADNSAVFKMVNNIWYSIGYEGNKVFTEPGMEYYNLNVDQTDLFSGTCISMINDFISESTNGMIKKVIEDVPGYPFFLINTFYFSGKWKMPFDVKETEPASFHNIDGSESTVNMMGLEGVDAKYFENEDVKVVSLPYGNGAYNFYAIMPKAKFKEYADGMSIEEWNSIKEGMRFANLSFLGIPRFESRFTFEDNSKVFSELGIGRILGPGALSELSVPAAPNSPMNIYQQTVFRIDETGAEGASETHFGAATFSPEAAASSPSIVLDRPFIYIVEEYSTSSILFIGSQVRF